MNRNRKNMMLLCVLSMLTAGFAVHAHEYTEVAGERIEGVYKGTKTTAELMGPRILPIEDDVIVMPLPYPMPCPMPYIEPQTKPAVLPLTLLKCPTGMPEFQDPSAPLRKVGLNFTAASTQDTELNFHNFFCDNGCVGKKQYILAAYEQIRSYSKKTGVADGVLDVNASFFFGRPVKKVHILYDQFNKCWFIAAEVNKSHLRIAVSNDSVIKDKTKWNFFDLNCNSTTYPDFFQHYGTVFQSLTMDAKALYCSVSAFNSANCSINYSLIKIEKKSLLKQKPAATVFSGLSFQPIPVNNFDKRPNFGYVIANPDWSNSNNDHIHLYRIFTKEDDQVILAGPVDIQVPSCNFPINIATPHVRKGRLYACHCINLDSTGAPMPESELLGVRWIQVSLSGSLRGCAKGRENANTVPVLIQSGTLYDAEKSYLFPAIMTSEKKDLVLSAYTFDKNFIGNIVFAGRKKGDPKGVLRTEVAITNNSVNQINGILTAPSITVDPVDSSKVWMFGEWSSVPNEREIQVTELVQFVQQ